MSVINTNVKALVAQESMRSNNSKLSTAMERLSTGLRINSAKDDAAGLAISNRMTAQIRGMSMAIKNANDGISMAQTADGAYGQVTSMLQRMRELAVQAANGAVSGSDRASIQLEIDELKAEINSVAERTNFNGIKLLDGTARDVKLQTGTNEGELMSVGFNSAKTKDIGSGDAPALSSIGGSVADFGALTSGQLTLNGVAVGASLRTDDNLSFETAGATVSLAASAIAKAAAINRVSAESGVVARVNDTQALGNSMVGTAGAAASSAAITINGQVTADITLGLDLSTNRQVVAKAINDISAQTGVRAVDTGSDKQGVLLIADDARNITVLSTFEGTNRTGLVASGTYVGTYSLYSNSGGSITVDQEIGDTNTNTGLRVGTFSSDIAQATSKNRGPAVSGTAPSSAAVGILNGDTLVINDIAIGAARAIDDTASVATTASSKASSAIAIAAAINAKSGLTGVTAKAEANVIRGSGATLFTAISAGGDLHLNGVTFAVNTLTRDNVIDSINGHTGTTGVEARAYGSGIELVAKDGRNISIGALDSVLTAGNLGLAGVTIGAAATSAAANAHYASVTLSSDKAFSVARGSEGSSSSGVSNFETLGFRVGTFGGNYTGLKVAEVDVTTQLGAGMAMTAIDAAINDISSAQARSGAFQNRLDAAVNVLAEQSENAQVARGRIIDTDYAQETTALAKAQIVQQAATAMLAQANQQQQSVLALLQ